MEYFFGKSNSRPPNRAGYTIHLLPFLSYNLIMKRKFFLLFILAMLVNPAFAIDLKLNNSKPETVKYEKETNEARVFYAQNNLEEALNALISIPSEDRNAENWLLMGNIQQDKGNLKEAVFLYESALLADNKYYKAYYNLGVLYFSQEKYSLALENFLSAKKYKNDLANIYYNLGCTYLNLGDFKKAKNEFMTAIELKNTEPDYYYNLALVYKKLGNEKKAKYYLDFYDKISANKD